MNAGARLLAAWACALLAPAANAWQDVPERLLRALDLAAAELLPRDRPARAEYLAEYFDPNLIVSGATTMSLVVLEPGAWNERALGYFTYEVDWRGRVRILDAQRIGRSGGAPIAGTCLVLEDENGAPRKFLRGEHVGLFLEPAHEFGLRKSGPFDPSQRAAFGSTTFTTLDCFNPEARIEGTGAARHAAMAWMPALEGFASNAPFLLVGFEDRLRARETAPGFRDVVFALIPASVAAISDTQVFDAATDDADGDSLADLYDAFPADPQRAFVMRTPLHGRATLALEEDYPEIGDLDYNDALVHFDWCTVSDARGHVKDVIGNFDLLSRRSRFDHRLALRLPILPEGVAGSVQIERFWGTTQQRDFAVRSIEESLAAFDGCLPDLIPSTRGARAALLSTRTAASGVDPSQPVPASARLWIEFEQSIDASWLEPMAFEPYFVVRRADFDRDVHLQGARGLSDRDPRLPAEQGPHSFVSRSGYPYLLYLPLDWRAPADGVAVWDLYPGFRTWVGSRGTYSADWFLRPAPGKERWAPDPQALIPRREWQLHVPTSR